jgi:hypothetical protein
VLLGQEYSRSPAYTHIDDLHLDSIKDSNNPRLAKSATVTLRVLVIPIRAMNNSFHIDNFSHA